MNNLTRAEINLTALAHNLEVIKSRSAGKPICAVVKANAYGHGLGIIAPRLHKLGVRSFAVSSVSEADELRGYIPSGDILILGMTPAESVNPDYIQTVASADYAKSLKGNVRVHIKLDTGMSRFGINTSDELGQIMRLPSIKPEAIFTHFPCADSQTEEDIAFTLNQQSKLVESASEYNLPYHSQNSAGVLNHSDFGGCMVRVGLALYGYFPELSQVMSLKSGIAQIREVGAGVSVSYGRAYVTESPAVLAVIPVGYADGYSRLHSGKGSVVIGGRPAPIRGRVCMDYIIADVTGLGARVGDEAEIYGESPDIIGIEHIAREIGTIPYEVTCSVASRVPRVAVEE
jgi:alanine racemase